MKTFLRFLPIPILLGIIAVALQAQDKKPQLSAEEKWEKAKAEKLKPVKDDMKAKIEESLPAATVAAKKERKVLVFWRCGGFVHGSINPGNFALEKIGSKSGAFTADFSDDYAVFTKENLAQYDGIVFNNTTHLVFPEESMRAALLEFLAQGKGVAGIHAAGDNFYKWEEGGQMIGGQFNGHPWNAGGKWAFQLDDPDHPLNKAFGGKGFWHTDEIYQYKPQTYAGAKKLRLLVSLDMTKKENTKQIKKEEDVKRGYSGGPRQVPVSWVQEFGGGRVFYTNFGHRDDTFHNTAVLQHMLDGIQYALGDLEADATPTGDSPEAPVPAPEQ